MDNKMKITLSLGTVICIVIIVFLIIALVGVICYNLDRKEEKVKNNITDNLNNKNEQVPTREEKNEDLKEKNNSIEEIKKISKKGTKFVIDKIEQKNNKNEITAYILENERKTFTKDEYNKIVNGQEFIFRNKIWKYEATQTVDGKANQVKSGNLTLAILFDKEENVYFLTNVAGAKTDGLADVEKNSIKFEIDNEFYLIDISNSVSIDDGVLKIEKSYGEENELKKSTIDDLKKLLNNNYGGSYEEFSAFAINGKIVAIQNLAI